MASQPLLLKLVVAALLSEFLSPTNCAEFSYNPGPNEPSNWGGKCKMGENQSPIDIGDMGIEEAKFENLALINYVGYLNMTVVNNGHSAQLTVNHPNRAMVTAGGLPGVYLLEQVHFHWPSEHTMLGKQYPLEIHFVHYEQNYISVQKALGDPEGMAVLAVLFHESPNTNIFLEPLINGIRSVTVQPNIPRALKDLVKIRALLPQDMSKFYRYHGSLTTPGCDESVVWTVFAETIPISSQQLQIFHQMKTKSAKPLDHNNRPLQQQNDRIVYFQSGPAPEIVWRTSNAPRVQMGSLSMVVLIITAAFMQYNC